MKRKFFIEKIATDLRKAFEVACLPDERQALVSDILKAAGYEEYIETPKKEFKCGNVPSSITAPPARWEDRSSRNAMSPVDFTLTAYQPWIGKGLTRGDIKRLDIRLYNALVKWAGRHPNHPKTLEIDQKLPAGERSSTAKLKSLGISSKM